jgi:hypothetical protein
MDDWMMRVIGMPHVIMEHVMMSTMTGIVRESTVLLMMKRKKKKMMVNSQIGSLLMVIGLAMKITIEIMIQTKI